MQDQTDEEKELLFDLFNTVNEKYILDKYIFPKLTTKAKTSKKYYVDDTIKIYKEFHPDFNLNISKDVRDIFTNQIATKDTYAQLGDKLVLKEIYSILFHIHQTHLQLDIVKSEDYPNAYFAKYDQDFRNIERLAQKYKKQIFDPEDGVPVSDKSEILFKWRLFTLYNKNKKLFEYYLNSMVIGDINCIVGFNDFESKDTKLFIDMLSYLSTQKTTPGVIKKSLWIMIYFKLVKNLHFTATEAEHLTYELMLNLFNYSLSSIDKKIYIRSIVNGLPVFGASRNSYYTIDQYNFIKSTIIKEWNDSSVIKEKIDDILKSNINKPYALPIKKYPNELLKLNPKYSEDQ